MRLWMSGEVSKEALEPFRLVMLYNVINVALSQLALFLEKAHQKKLLNVPEPMLTAQLIIAPFILSVLMQVLFFGEDRQADRARIQALLQVHQKILMNYLTATQ